MWALMRSVLRPECLCTCALQTLHRGGESFGPGQQVVFELGETFTLCNLHTDLMLLLCKASSLTIQQKLWRSKKSVEAQSHSSEMTPHPSSRAKINHS